MANRRFHKTATATAVSYGVLKAFKNSADPYTRSVLGAVIGSGALMLGGADYKAIGMGIWAGSILNGIEIKYGGRITRNHFSGILYVLHETEGVKLLQPGEVPPYNFDGLTLPGAKKVFKLCDGVHCHISETGAISVPALGGVVNGIKNGGWHNLDWCHKTGDNRWVELFNKSL